MLYPTHFEQKIEFDKIRNLLKNHCISELGKAEIDKLNFSSNADKINLQTSQILEFVEFVQTGDEFPIEAYFDTNSYLKRLKTEGTYLTESELFELYRSLLTIRSIVNLFESKDEKLYTNLKALCNNVKHFPEITRHISSLLDKFGRIKDNASPELAQIRQSKLQLSASISKLLSNIIKQAQKDGYLDKDVNPSIREGRLVVPISPAFKRKLGGIVHDESASGKTAYVEPGAVVEANNKIRELEMDEKRELIKILINCADFIRPYRYELKSSNIFLGQIDSIRAKALFAIRTNATKPKSNKFTHIKWINATHPLLYLSLKEQNRNIVPLDIELNKENRILVISGPNAGGKSVCLKTVGLLQYMWQCGLLVPMQEDSEMGLFRNVFIDIGDEQSLENDLSTYSSHLTNMKHFVKFGDAHSLLLIDEFGSGTEPLIGGAIAEAELKVFNKNKCFGVINTHYTNIKHFASQTEGLANGAMLYDRHQMQPLFQLSIGNPGSSFAIEIAKKIGLPKEVIEDASNMIGGEHVDYDKNLQDIVRDKRYWESKRQQIKIKEKKSRETQERLQLRLDEIDKEKKRIIRNAKDEATRLLSETNATIEKTIREIKEAKAEKERTKEIRKQIQQTKTDLQQKVEFKNPAKQQKNKNVNAVIKVGNSVKYNDNIGEVLSIDGKKATIAFGLLKSIVELDKLEKANRKMQREVQNKQVGFVSSQTNEFIRKSKLNFKQNLDIRGQRVDEALQTVMYYIDEAIMVGVSDVRILHGTGTGALRQEIRNYLSSIPEVKSAKDERIQLGGAGITVVEFY